MRKFRGFIKGLVVRDFKMRYLNSVLGSLWSILNPLSNILVYTLIFSHVMKSKLPGIDDTMAYSVYLCAGLLPWNYFIETLQRGQNMFIEQGNLLRKVSFPKVSLPSFVFISSTINFVIIYLLFLIFLVIVGRTPGYSIIAVIPLLILQQAISVGLGVFFGTLNVFFRDIGYTVGVITQFWFWLTPIVYAAEIIPEEFKKFFIINPMYPIIKGYQDIYLYHVMPEWKTLSFSVVFAILALLLGYITYKRLNDEMVDEL